MRILIKKKTSMAGVALLSLSALALFIGISCVTLEEVKAAVPEKLAAGVFEQQGNKSPSTQNKPVQKREKDTTTTVKEEMIPAKDDLKVNRQDDEELFQLADTNPKFQGGDVTKFVNWVSKQLVYPADARKYKVQGQVVVQFVVDEEGNVCNVKILRGVWPSLNQEAIRVVAMSPQWTPGSLKGKNIKVRFAFPLTFKVR